MNSISDKKGSSFGDSEGSNDEQDSKLHIKFESLQLQSSFDSTGSEYEETVSGKTSRGKPTNPKIKQMTSRYVRHIIESCDTNKSPETLPSLSPSSEYPSYNFPSPNFVPTTTGNQVIANTSPPPLPNGLPNRNLKDIIRYRIFRKTRVRLNQWVFDFGDTTLMKCCRQGQIEGVRCAIRELIENQKLELINHQNAARETALSIATYQMNEIMIELLLQSRASPICRLPMNNNVLHIAADMTMDTERKTFGYLIKGIMTYQREYLFEALMAKNIFNVNPITVLRFYHDCQCDNSVASTHIQYHIKHAQEIINSFCQTIFIQ